MGTIDDFLAFFGLARLGQLQLCAATQAKVCEELVAQRTKYADLVRKIEAKAYKSTTPSKKPLTGAQLRRLNEQENAAFLDDRGEPTNSEILKEQAHG